MKRAAPALLEPFGVGPETAGQLLASAGDYPERIRSEAAFAHLAGVAPPPVSSGRTHRMRCLKRFVAREVYRALTSAPTTHITQTDLAPTA
ncbi:transposase [Kitasatospora sp. NPDC097605]|uniref:transposase n=1 Tax=Kitasatospora sp. NPDC097605 TaxID=3157226 RepID=UPI00332B16DB